MFRRFTTRRTTFYTYALAIGFTIGCSGTDSPAPTSLGAGGTSAIGGAGGARATSVAGAQSVAGNGGVAGSTSVAGSASVGGSGASGNASAAGSSGNGGAPPVGGMGTAGASVSGAGSGGAAPNPNQKKAAYVYGSVAANGTIPAPAGQEYDQMRLTDTGDLGCSQYKMEIEKLGYSLTEVYDRTTTFDLGFLNQYSVIIFGNHQKVMSTAEQAAIATWVANGGGLLAYSDSALGGKYDVVGISNTVGQKAVNSIISQFGMQVLTDQGNGTCAMKAPDGETNPIVYADGRSLVIEGEGEPVVCVDPNAGVKILIPFSEAAKVGQSGSITTNNVGGGMTIANPLYAALALKEVARDA